MPATLPLEVALQIVDIARFRRLDESAIEHMRRLTRIGLACRAFYGVVERTMTRTLFATLSTDLDKSFDRTLAAARAGRPFETLYLRTEDDAMESWRITEMHGRDTLRKLVLLSKVFRPSLVRLSWFGSESFPALECLVASGSLIQGQPTHPYLALRELAIDLDAPHWVQQLVSPSVTPNLRVLAVCDCGPLAPRAYDLFDDDLLARLDFIQLTLRPFHFDSTNQLFSQRSTPILVCPIRGAAGGIIPDDFCPPYLQLHSVGSSDNTSTGAVLHLTACIRKGAARKALFLPQNLHPSSDLAATTTLDYARNRLLKAIDEHEVEYVGWYHADDETDASPSEPFRRYLDRDRLEGRL